MTPNWYQPFFEPGFGQGLVNVLDGPEKIVMARINTTLHDWLVMFQIPTQISRSISILAFIIGLSILATITWKSKSLLRIMVAAILVNFAITPYALQYDYPLLTLVLFWAIALTQFGQKRWIGIAGSVLIFLLPVSYFGKAQYRMAIG